MEKKRFILIGLFLLFTSLFIIGCSEADMSEVNNQEDVVNEESNLEEGIVEKEDTQISNEGIKNENNSNEEDVEDKDIISNEEQPEVTEEDKKESETKEDSNKESNKESNKDVNEEKENKEDKTKKAGSDNKNKNESKDSKSKEKSNEINNKNDKLKDQFVTEPFNGDFMSKVSLNVRKGPGLDYGIVGHLNPGEKVNVLEKTTFKGMEWYKVNKNGLTGWSSASYLFKYDENFKKELEKKKQSSYKPNTIYFSGKAVPYKNGGQANGQAIIDGGVYASTWGGTKVFSGTDGKNTHLIGHNPGQFSGMHLAKEFIVTDGNGTPFRYVVDRVYKVNEYAIGVSDGVNYWDRIVGTGGGERIVLQSTYDHPIKWIVEASPR